MHCNFKNTPFNPNVIHWLYGNLKLNRKLHIFNLRIPQLKQNKAVPSEIPHLSENHAFSLRKSPI